MFLQELLRLIYTVNHKYRINISIIIINQLVFCSSADQSIKSAAGEFEYKNLISEESLMFVMFIFTVDDDDDDIRG